VAVKAQGSIWSVLDRDVRELRVLVLRGANGLAQYHLVFGLWLAGPAFLVRALKGILLRPWFLTRVYLVPNITESGTGRRRRRDRSGRVPSGVGV
jgi:hypothetical protein